MADFYPDNNSLSDVTVKMLQENDPTCRALSLNLNRMEKEISPQLAHWRESLFSFQVESWCDVIKSNEVVEEVSIDLSLTGMTIWKKDQIKMLLDAVASLPNLRKITIRQNNLGGMRRRLGTVEAITSAIRSCYSTLEEFELWGQIIAPGVEHSLQKLLWSLHACKRLELLKIHGFDLTSFHISMILPLMKMPSLREFGLGNSTGGFMGVADVLATNTTLEKLTLSFMDVLDDDCCFALARALRCNTQLRALSLFNAAPSINISISGISLDGQTAFLQAIMTQNMTLHEFQTRGQVGAKLLMYLKLNKVGRRQLFEKREVTRELWVDKVTMSKEDVDCSFYFLTMNPAICTT